jgi:hypothetical protein
MSLLLPDAETLLFVTTKSPKLLKETSFCKSRGCPMRISTTPDFSFRKFPAARRRIFKEDNTSTRTGKPRSVGDGHKMLLGKDRCRNENRRLQKNRHAT